MKQAKRQNVIEDQLDNRIETTINQLSVNNINEILQNQIDFLEPKKINNNKSKQMEQLIIKNQKLYVGFEKSISNNLYFFYGHVKLELLKKEKQEDSSNKILNLYTLKFKTKDINDRWITTGYIYRGLNEDDINEKEEYFIACIGKYNHKFRQIKLKKKNKSIIIKKLAVK